jgi:hypothetical protein
MQAEEAFRKELETFRKEEHIANSHRVCRQREAADTDQRYTTLLDNGPPRLTLSGIRCARSGIRPRLPPQCG